jgi:hypothetical protein
LAALIPIAGRFNLSAQTRELRRINAEFSGFPSALPDAGDSCKHKVSPFFVSIENTSDRYEWRARDRTLN